MLLGIPFSSFFHSRSISSLCSLVEHITSQLAINLRIDVPSIVFRASPYVMMFWGFLHPRCSIGSFGDSGYLRLRSTNVKFEKPFLDNRGRQ